jgi:hypothetical protein
MFFINPFNPLDIKVVGRPVSSGGEFPVSLAVSKKTGDGTFLELVANQLTQGTDTSLRSEWWKGERFTVLQGGFHLRNEAT